VRPGDRLEDLAVRYLGNRDLWRGLWTLNPKVQDPNLLFPGSRVRVTLEGERAVPAARVERVARTVEAKPEPQSWLPVGLHDFLIERDGVRTQDGSSAELRFSDGDRLRVGENSLVFLQLERGRLRGARTPGLQGTASGVEIRSGQADLEMVPAAERRAKVGVEVRVAGARVSVAAPETETGRSRARTQGGDAQLMVYSGAAAVEAAGSTVEVPAGSGTSVAPGAAPRPPEPLLPAPALVAPAADLAQPLAGAKLSWRPVDRATGYVVEVCADAQCGQLVARAGVGPEVTEWTTPALAAGRHAWRVTARAASGLDGFPSPARWFDARAITDRRPPTGRIELSGRSVESRGRRIFRADSRVNVIVEDTAAPGEQATGVAGWTLEVSGQPVPRSWLEGPFATGQHELVVRAVDHAGNEARIGPVRFDVDASAPAITWEVVAGASAAGSAALPWDGRLSALEWKAVDPMWLAWQWSASERDLDPLPLSWSAAPAAAGAAAMTTEVALVVGPAVTFTGEVTASVPSGSALRVRFSDSGGDLARASIRREASAGPGARGRLVLEARDLLGNETRLTTSVSWP
jgi:hypothetical protein